MSRPPHPRVDAVARALAEAGAGGEVRLLPAEARTAAAAAAALDVPVGAIVNSLVFLADGSPVLILTSGAHRVDTTRTAATIGRGRLRRATPEFVRTHTGQVIGGVSPIDHPRALPTYLDTALRQHPEIWAAAGHPAAVFSTTYDELRTMTGATEIEVR